MKKSNQSAADGTCAIWPEVLLAQENHAPKLVEDSGVRVKRIDLMGHGKVFITPAWHYVDVRRTTHTLCGKEVAKYDRCQHGPELPSLGTCAACRAQASILRAVLV